MVAQPVTAGGEPRLLLLRTKVGPAVRVVGVGAAGEGCRPLREAGDTAVVASGGGVVVVSGNQESTLLCQAADTTKDSQDEAGVRGRYLDWVHARSTLGGKPAAALANVRRAKEVACKYVTAMADTDGQRHVYKVCGACVRSLLAMGGGHTSMRAAQAGASFCNSFCRDTGLTAEAALAADDEAGGRDDIQARRVGWQQVYKVPEAGGRGAGERLESAAGATDGRIGRGRAGVRKSARPRTKRAPAKRKADQGAEASEEQEGRETTLARPRVAKPSSRARQRAAAGGRVVHLLGGSWRAAGAAMQQQDAFRQMEHQRVTAGERRDEYVWGTGKECVGEAAQKRRRAMGGVQVRCVRKEYIRPGCGEPQVEYELGGATEQLSKYGPHEITVVCKRRGEQAHGVVLGELERPVVRRKVRNWRTTLNPTDADLHFRKVVVAAVAGGEGTRPLIVKVDPAVATVRDIKKGVEQAWGIPPEEQQLYRQPKAWGEECGEDEGSVAADNEGVGEDGGYSMVRGLSNGAGQSSAEQSTGREDSIASLEL